MSPRNELELDRWMGENAPTDQKRRWHRAAIAVDKAYAGKERECPNCGTQFVSAFNRGQCPDCGAMFFASNPSCGSNAWLRVPGDALFSDPIKYDCPEICCFALDSSLLQDSDDETARTVIESECESIDSVDGRHNQSPIDCRRAIHSLLTGSIDSFDESNWDLYRDALEIVCSSLGKLLYDQDLRLLAWDKLPFESLTSAFQLASSKLDCYEFPGVAFLPRKRIPDELAMVKTAQPRLPGSEVDSEWISEQLLTYQSILEYARDLDLDVFAFDV